MQIAPPEPGSPALGSMPHAQGLVYGSVCSGIEVGQRYGRLTVLDRIPGKRCDQWRWRWRCRCECGTVLIIVGNSLRTGRNKSCGCFRRDRAGALYRSHGKSKTTEYIMFYDARKRAQRFGVPFAITPEDIIVPELCPVLGLPLDGSKRDRKPSLDRIVPEFGYVPGNIQVISFRANRIKSDANSIELRCILSYVEGCR